MVILDRGFVFIVAMLSLQQWPLTHSISAPEVHIKEDQGADYHVVNLKELFPELNVATMSYRILNVQLKQGDHLLIKRFHFIIGFTFNDSDRL